LRQGRKADLIASGSSTEPRLRTDQKNKQNRDIMMKSLALSVTAAALAAFATVEAAEKAAPSDPQIAMIAVVAGNVDVDAGKVAVEKAHDKRVKEFAKLMVRDHSAVNEKAAALVKKLGVTPEESGTSKSLKADGDKMLAKLNKLKGAEFDKAYVDNEVSYHEAVIGVLDKTLIPNTKNAELKSLLKTARPVFASHLEHARMIQGAIKK
jgi:putative membrane protein